MLVKKKQILTATLVIALATAVAVNWYYSKSDTVIEPESTVMQEVSGNLGDTLLVAGSVHSGEEGDADEAEEESTAESVDASAYFASAKLRRKTAQDQTADEMEKLAQSDGLSSDDKDKLISMLDEYSRAMKAQSDTENLIEAKLGCECVVIINGSTAQVILPQNMLNETVLVQITDIFEKNTEISAENLTIIEAK